MPPPEPAPTLPVELLEQIFLRLPPDEPAWLVRASLASKFWLGLLTGTRFQGLYREFHGAPPMLGFLYNWPLEYAPEEEDTAPHFVSTTKFGAHNLNWEDYNVLDCRHGRVLLFHVNWSSGEGKLIVWNPITGSRKEVGAPDVFCSIWAAVLCPVTDCDHRACHEGPFRVVFVGLDKVGGGYLAYDGVSSPETDGIEWGETSHGFDHLLDNGDVQPLPPVLVDDALHFMLVHDDDHVGVLKYDLLSTELSLIDAPLAETDDARDVILMAMEGGSLGFAHVDGLTFNLWSRQMGDSDGAMAWTQRIVINLRELLPIRNPEKRLRLIGSVEGCDIVFVTTDLGIYEINLKSLQQKKIWKREKYSVLFPYMSFYSPQGTEHVDKNNLEMAKCKVGRS